MPGIHAAPAMPRWWQPAFGNWQGAFLRIHARWVLLFSVVGGILLVILGGLLAAAGIDVSGDTDLAFASLIYVPLVAWIGWNMWRHGLQLKPFFALPRIGTYWFVVLGMTLAMLVFSIGASSITSALLPTLGEGAGIAGDTNPWVLLITVVVLPPLVEELTFRGMLLERWSVKWRIGVAVVVQAICFGVLHADPIGAGLFGVCQALFYLRTRSLVVPMVIHFLNNGIVSLFILFDVGGSGDTSSASQGQSTSLGEALTTGIIAIAISLPFIWLFIRRNWPGPDTITPYEEFEHGRGALPPRRLGPVTVAGARYRWILAPHAVLISRDGKGFNLAWQLPYDSVTHVAASPDGRSIGLAMNDGAVFRLTSARAGLRSRGRAVTALHQRLSHLPLMQLTSAEREQGFGRRARS